MNANSNVLTEVADSLSSVDTAWQAALEISGETGDDYAVIDESQADEA